MGREQQGAQSPRRAREKLAHRGAYRKNQFPKQLAWKTKGAKFFKFLKPAGLNIWSFKGHCAWLCESQESLVQLLERWQAKNLWKYSMETVI